MRSLNDWVKKDTLEVGLSVKGSRDQLIKKTTDQRLKTIIKVFLKSLMPEFQDEKRQTIFCRGL